LGLHLNALLPEPQTFDHFFNNLAFVNEGDDAAWLVFRNVYDSELFIHLPGSLLFLLGSFLASWFMGILLLKLAGKVVDSISPNASYEEGMSLIRYGIVYAGLGFCFLFLLPHICIGRLPTREEMTLLKNQNLNHPIDRTSQAQSGHG
jgi:hypothetical protein